MNGPRKIAMLATLFLALATFPAGSAAGTGDQIALEPKLLSQGGFPGLPPAKRNPLALYREERFIRFLYRGFLGREPGRNEIDLWGRRMDQGAMPGQIIHEFMNSDEYFIRQIYLGLLERAPDVSGFNANMQSLRGGQSRDDLVDNLLRSPEFQKRLH